MAVFVLPGLPGVVTPAAAEPPTTEAPDLTAVGNFRAGPDNDEGGAQTYVDFTFDQVAYLNGGDRSNFHLVPLDASDAVDGRGIVVDPAEDPDGDDTVTVLFTGDVSTTMAPDNFARGYLDTGVVGSEDGNISADAPANVNQSEPISNGGVTANPDIVSITKDGDQVLWEFDQPLTDDDVVQNNSGLALYFPTAEQVATIPSAGASVVTRENPTTLRATYNTLPSDFTLDDAAGGYIDVGTVQAVPADAGGNDGVNAFQDDAPLDDTGKVVCAEAPEAGETGDGSGPTDAPDLVSVGNFRPGPTTTQGGATTCVDFVFDQAATIVNGTPSSFALVPLDAGDALPGTTNVTAPNDQENDRVITIPFDGDLDPADFARGFLDSEVVSSDAGGASNADPANINQAEPVSPDTTTANPDVVSITRDGDQVLFEFDQPLTEDDVSQNSSGLRLYFPEPTGANAVIPFAGSSLVDVESPTTLRATYNSLPGEFTLDDAVGGYVVQGTVQAVAGEGGGNDGNNAFDELFPLDDTGAEVCPAAPETGETGDGSGPTTAPDLLAVGNLRRGPVTTQGSATTCVDFVFDQVAWLNGGDLSNFSLVPSDGGDAISGTTNVDTPADEAGDRVVTVAFPGDIDPADVARGFVDTSVVTSREAGANADNPFNVNQSEDIDPDTATDNPDVTAVKQSANTYLFEFDQALTDDDVIQNTSGLRLYFPDAAGGSTIAFAGSSRVERVDARTLRATYVDLPGDYTLSDAVGAFVVQGTVQAAPGEGGANAGANGFHEILPCDTDDCVAANQVTRVAGSHAIATAIELSATAFPDGADAAVLARVDRFPDALAATPLAIAADGPVLLNPSDELNPDVADELERLGVDTVYLAGGTKALSTQVADDLADLGVDVQRLSGPGRMETAAAIAQETAQLNGGADDVVLARSDSFADALSAANLAEAVDAPLVLTPTDTLANVTADTISSLAPDTVWIIGGTGAISPDTEDAVADLGPDVRRIGGQNRYETARLVADVAEDNGLSVEPTVLASGADFRDAVAAGPAAAALGGRLLLANPSGANDALLAELEDDAATIDLVYIAGGTAALPDTLDPAVLEAITTAEEAAG